MAAREVRFRSVGGVVIGPGEEWITEIGHDRAGLVVAKINAAIALALEEQERAPDKTAEDPRLPQVAADPWVHRSAKMSCATCMWYVEKARPVDAGEAVKLGRCRRHAPTMSGYPVVFPSDWCGDHKLDEAKA